MRSTVTGKTADLSSQIAPLPRRAYGHVIVVMPKAGLIARLDPQLLAQRFGITTRPLGPTR